MRSLDSVEFLLIAVTVFLVLLPLVVIGARKQRR